MPVCWIFVSNIHTNTRVPDFGFGENGSERKGAPSLTIVIDNLDTGLTSIFIFFARVPEEPENVSDCCSKVL
jgi:hypothetical protein